MERVKEYGSESIAYYMGTRSIVDDIMAIVERHGQWREAEARKLLEDNSTALQMHERQQVFENTEWRRGKEEALFWGTSYGTILGSTLAATYPGRIRRMILDSVESPQYFFNASVGDSLIHADKILAEFVHLCHKYGPRNCEFYRESEEIISQDMDTLISRLRFAPLSVPATLDRGPDLITWTDMRRLIGQSLYRPHHSFPMLARVLNDVFTGNGSRFADYKAAIHCVSLGDAQQGLYNLAPKCKTDGPYSAACSRPGEWLEESLLGITCGDGGLNHNITKEQFRTYWDTLKAQSSTMGDIWSEWDLTCVGWNAKSRWQFEGKLNSPLKKTNLETMLLNRYRFALG